MNMNKILKTLLVLLEVGGGLIGIALIAEAILTENPDKIGMMVHCGFILVFVFGILAGISLTWKPRLGLLLSLIYQGIQIPIIISSKLSFDLFSGATFSTFWHETGFGVNFFFGSRYCFYINGGQPWCAGVNILALVLFILLIRELWFCITASTTSESEVSGIPEQSQIAELQPSCSWRG
jgi:hypothetical protein